MLCCDVMLEDGVINPAAIVSSLQRHGAEVEAWQVVDVAFGNKGQALRLAAKRSNS